MPGGLRSWVIELGDDEGQDEIGRQSGGTVL